MCPKRSTASLARLTMDPSIWPPAPPSASSDGQNNNHARAKQPSQLPINVIFVIGAPGAGKGTICKQAAEKLGYYHLSAGDYLRDLANNSGNYAQESYAGLDPIVLSETMKRSQLMRSENIVEILRFKLEKECNAGWTKFMVDGFPRSAESAEAYEQSVNLFASSFIARGPF